jgi:hypothetical protein
MGGRADSGLVPAARPFCAFRLPLSNDTLSTKGVSGKGLRRRKSLPVGLAADPRNLRTGPRDVRIQHMERAVSSRRLANWENGPGVFKVDWALDGPIPWTDEASGRAGTVHVGGTYEEVAEAEAAVHADRHPERPFVIVAQQSLFDPTRAPDGMQTGWAYCHVPAGSKVSMTDAIETQVERFAPGFRDRILAKHVMGPAGYENYNPNYVGGDIGGGAFGLRRAMRFGTSRPYRIGKGLYLCSSATPPGAGVHACVAFTRREPHCLIWARSVSRRVASKIRTILIHSMKCRDSGISKTSSAGKG